MCTVCRWTCIEQVASVGRREASRDMIIFPSLDDQPSGRVDNRLKWMQMYSARQTEDTVTVVHTTGNERVNKCFLQPQS